MYDRLKQEIITGKITAGTRIIETEYAEILHVSRTPLREALHMLELDELVENNARRGTVVKTFTANDIEEIYMIRNTLEIMTLPYIIANVCDKDIEDLHSILSAMDEQMNNEDVSELSSLARLFHQRFIAISRLNRVLTLIKNQDEFLLKYSKISIEKESKKLESHEEHHLMLRYLRDKNIRNLEAVVKKHIERSKLICLSVMKNTSI